jgi:hypothetical protein
MRLYTLWGRISMLVSLVLWLEVRAYNPNTEQSISVPPQRVRLKLTHRLRKPRFACLILQLPRPSGTQCLHTSGRILFRSDDRKYNLGGCACQYAGEPATSATGVEDLSAVTCAAQVSLASNRTH